MYYQGADNTEKRCGLLFSSMLKSIAFDNDSGFAVSELYESLGFTVYYAHSYSVWERGTNENINRTIRRFIPKGKDICKYAKAEIKRIQDWINNYPRRILGGLMYAAFEKYEGVKNGLIQRLTSL